MGGICPIPAGEQHKSHSAGSTTGTSNLGMVGEEAALLAAPKGVQSPAALQHTALSPRVPCQNSTHGQCGEGAPLDPPVHAKGSSCDLHLKQSLGWSVT